MDFFVGVDGCKSGWIAVCISGEGEWSYQLFDSVDALYDRFDGASRILIDMQIGLVGDGAEGAGGRKCEFEGRKLLGAARRSSIFVAPSRLALAAPDYLEASRTNFVATGRKLSKQTWWIMSKIREVDELLHSRPEARDNLYEVNIELLFRALNDSQPMSYYKKTREGFSERMELLGRWYPPSTDLYKDALGSFLRKDVSRDDIVDATAAAVSMFVARGMLKEIPAVRQLDSRGLPMRMVVPDITGTRLQSG